MSLRLQILDTHWQSNLEGQRWQVNGSEGLSDEYFVINIPWFVCEIVASKTD